MVSSNNSLGHASKALELKESHKRNKKDALILGTFQKIVIIFKPPSCILFPGVFLLKLFFRIEVNLQFNIINKKVNIVLSGLPERKYLAFLRNMQLRNNYLHYLLNISLKIYYQLRLLTMSYQLIQPISPQKRYLRLYVLLCSEVQRTYTLRYQRRRLLLLLSQ